MLGYPKKFQPLFWCAVALLCFSGLLLIPGALELRLDWDVPWHLPDGSRVYVAMLHAFGAFAVLVAVGALIPLHMRMGLRRKHNVVSGLTVATLAGLLVLTSLGVYYFADERASLWSSALHIVLSIIAVVATPIHVVLGRKLAKRRRAYRMHWHEHPSASPHH
jgi:hypothetical protein